MGGKRGNSNTQGISQVSNTKPTLDSYCYLDQAYTMDLGHRPFLWTQVSSMNHRRAAFGAVAFGDLAFVFGGDGWSGAYPDVDVIEVIDVPVIFFVRFN